MPDSRNLIYIDDQPVDEIGEIDLIPVEPDEIPEAVPKQLVKLMQVAEPAEINVMLPSEALNALGAVVRQAAESIKAIWESIREVLPPIFDVVVSDVTGIFDKCLRVINPRWYHLSKYAKKARIRKKYRDRLMRAFNQMINAEGAKT